ncbi:MAG TPA: hypothetical protein VD948_08915 [Rhodothermales bacterium]|nr:hypothetical protein [Rhodothermales bacterium]
MTIPEWAIWLTAYAGLLFLGLGLCRSMGHESRRLEEQEQRAREWRREVRERREVA